MKAFKEFLKKNLNDGKTSSSTNSGSSGSGAPTAAPPPTAVAPPSSSDDQKAHAGVSATAPSNTEDESTVLARNGSVIGTQSLSQRFRAARSDSVSSAAPKPDESGSQPSAPQQKQDMLNTAVWIDSETKKSIVGLNEDLTVGIVKSFNNPALGLYHVQYHCQSRVPKVVECGKSLGGLVVSHQGTLKSSTHVLGQVTAIAETKAFVRIAEGLQRDITRIRSRLPTPSQLPEHR
jgi:hypothetical protein